MGFLDNSGDIILDAVLTDLGRERLARGDGSFKIVKFALGDDEINYELFDKNNASGSSYYDVNILQTPVLEAFTDNAISMKSKLISLSRDDILFLPVMELYEQQDSARDATANAFIILVDKTTVTSVAGKEGAALPAGVQDGNLVGNSGHLVRIDQGLDTTAISKQIALSDDLTETQFLLEMDNRLGYVATPTGNPAKAAAVSFVDDDEIASYILTSDTDDAYITSIGPTQASSIDGPRGNMVRFRVGATTELRTSNYLFNVLGSTGTSAIGSLGASSYRFIDTMVSVVGQNTGYRIDIPIRFVKQT